MSDNTLKKAIKLAGGIQPVSIACGVSYEAARKWYHNGFPRTEWTGETHYSEIIAGMQSEYTVNDLLIRTNHQAA